VNASHALRVTISTLLLAWGGVAQAQTTLPPVIVVGTQPGGGLGSGGGGGGYGGSSSGGDQQEENPVPPEGCNAFLLRKPANCPNPIPRPEGAEFGFGTFRSGSAMGRAIAYVITPTRHPETQRRIAEALSNQTRDAGLLYNSLDTVNQRLFDDVRNACVSLKVSFDANPPPFAVRPTPDERECAAILDLIVEERGDPGFLPWFLNWVAVQGFDMGNFIPQTLVNLLSPENTLTQKFSLTQQSMQCALWWDWQETYQCQL